MRRQTVSITQGSITAALTVVLILTDRMLAGFIMTFIPLPLIVYGMYHPMKESIITYVATVFLVMIVPGQLPTTILMITYGIVALVYIVVNKTELKKSLKFIIIYLSNLVNYLIMMTFFGKFFGLEMRVFMLEIKAITRISNQDTLFILATAGLLFTVLLETFIIYVGANQLSYLMKRHRK